MTLKLGKILKMEQKSTNLFLKKMQNDSKVQLSDAV